MPSTPYAKVLVSVNGGGNTSGGIDVPSAATLALTPESTVGWTQARWEFYDYPEGWATPAGWSLGADGVIYSTAFTPPAITLPAAASGWGTYMLRLRINEQAIDDTKLYDNLLDDTTSFCMLSPKGQRDTGARELFQFTTPTTRLKGSLRSYQRNLRAIEGQLGLGVGSSSDGTEDELQATNNSGGFVKVANVKQADGDLCTGTNLGAVATAGAHRSRAQGYQWLARSSLAAANLGVVEMDVSAGDNYLSIGSAGTYSAAETFDQLWFSANKKQQFYIDGGIAFELGKYGSSYLQILTSQQNLVLFGATAGSLVESYLGGGKGIIFLGPANVVPTTNPPASTLLAYVDPADGVLKLRRPSGGVAPIVAPASAIPALNIDWSKSAVHTKDLAAGANALTFSNAVSGLVITVRLTGHASGSTVSWPAGIKWPDGAAPTQTSTGTDVYTFFHDGTNVYGIQQPNFSS